MACAILLIAGTAEASPSDDDIEIAGPVLGFGTYVSVPVGIFAIAGNIVCLVKNEKASTANQVAGYVTGAMMIAIGAGWIYYFGDDDTDFLLFGVGHMILGAADIGITIWATIQPKKKQKLSLAPIIMPDTRGHPVVGIGLRLANW